MGRTWSYLKVRKRWWVTPLVLAALLLALLALASRGSSPAPFVYTLF